MKNSKFILDYLKQKFPEAKCELNYSNIFELLIAVILSAQCTDKRVNQVTQILFKKYPTMYELQNANLVDVEEIIKPCGMYHQKAKNLILCSQRLVKFFSGQVPNTIEELTTLNGVGHKTASVVLCEGFKIPAMPVDTHIFRVSKRLGLSNGKTVEKVEEDLKKIYPESDWIDLHFRIVLFGRYFCKAIKPECINCGLKDICNFYKEK
ncbi:MAG: endonuclease III [Clostridia bacterium]|nr:endonuclease III [Clostridia bacterium]